MKLSPQEKKALKQSAVIPAKGITQKIRDYPGRVVTEQQAYDRIRKGKKALHEACTKPLMSNYQRNNHRVSCHDDPEFIADIKSTQGNRKLARKWDVDASTIKNYRRRS